MTSVGRSGDRERRLSAGHCAGALAVAPGAFLYRIRTPIPVSTAMSHNKIPAELLTVNHAEAADAGCRELGRLGWSTTLVREYGSDRS